MTSQWIVLVFFIAALWLQLMAPFDPQWLDAYYSNGINLWFRQIQGVLFGWFPFSLAEIVVILGAFTLTLWWGWLIFLWLRSRFRDFKHLVKGLSSLLLISMVLYSAFVFFWGLNYHRPNLIAVDGVVQNEQQLEKLCELLARQASLERQGIDSKRLHERLDDKGFKSLGLELQSLYRDSAVLYPSLRGNYSNPKPIGLSIPFSYTGIVGIYFPFTGEANINTNEVPFLLPSTMAHEMAHQRGYAREEDANFIAYLVLKQSDTMRYRYSGTLLALIHASNRLYQDSPEAYNRVRSLYSQELIQDLQYMNAYWEPYRGRVEEKVTQVNDNYLKANGQAEGVVSYSLMIKLLLAYYEAELK